MTEAQWRTALYNYAINMTQLRPHSCGQTALGSVIASGGLQGWNCISQDLSGWTIERGHNSKFYSPYWLRVHYILQLLRL